MNKIISILNNLGLNEKESKVYLACLELGSATVQELSEKSGVKRTSIYNFLEELKTKGLITEIKQDRKTLLVAEDPQVLRKSARDKVKEAEEYAGKIETALPELLGIFNLPGEKPKVKFYGGLEGIKQVYEDTLTEGGPIYAFTDYEKLLNTIEPDYMIDYARRRAEAGIFIYSVSPPGPWAEKAIEMGKEQKREVKIVAGLKFETEINIYGNKVALISFRRPYAGVIIEDRAIAKTLKSVWKVIA